MTTISDSVSATHPMRLGVLIAAMATGLAARRRGSNLVRQFQSMDDHMLADIGLTRDSVSRAAFASDPTSFLRHERNRR